MSRHAPTPGPRLRLLYLEDDRTDLELLDAELRRSSMLYELRHVDDHARFVRELERFEPHAVLADYQLPSFDGMTALQIVLERSPETPFIFVSGALGDARATETLKMGAADYVLKDRLHRLVPAIHGAVERSRERTARHEAEEMYRTLFDHVPIGLFRSAPDGRFIDVNRAAVEMFGFADAREMLACDPTALFADPTEHDQIRARLEVDGALRDHEFEARRRDGTLLWVRSSARAVLAGGSLRYAEGTMEDITAERHNRDRLEESEERHRIISSLVSDYAYSIAIEPDASLRLEWVTEAFQRQFGVTVEEANARGLMEFVHPDDRERAMAALGRVLAGEHADIEYRMLARDGSTRWVRSRIRARRDPLTDGVVRLVGSSEDVTERKEADLALLRSEGRLRDAQAVAHVGSWEWDPETDEVQWSDELYRILGYAPGEVAASRQLYIQMVHPEDRAGVIAEVEQAKSKDSVSYHHRIVRGDGTVAHVSTQGRRLRSTQGGGWRLLGTVADVTEMELARQALEEKALQQQVVADLARKACEDIALDDLYQEAARAVATTLSLDMVSMFELLPNGQELFLRGGYGWQGDYVGSVTVPADERTQAWQAIRLGAPVVSVDIAADPRFEPLWFRSENGVISGAVVVMQAGGEPFGAIVADSVTPRMFSEREVTFLQMVANILAGFIRRAEAEHALRVSEQRYRSLFEGVPVGLYRSTRDGRILEANPAMAQILGFDSSEALLQGRAESVYLDPADREHWVEQLEERGE
ncbi:MAG TPA: PAS domain S-box protein, partial [Actinomycetota bacterium]|nr:PAS domain S-box protein [Actinomycetota bacterium]